MAATDLIEDAFGAIARDGAGIIEVQQRLQKALARLIKHSSPDMADAALIAAQLSFLRASTDYAVLDALDNEAADGSGSTS